MPELIDKPDFSWQLLSREDRLVGEENEIVRQTSDSQWPNMMSLDGETVEQPKFPVFMQQIEPSEKIP